MFMATLFISLLVTKPAQADKINNKDKMAVPIFVDDITVITFIDKSENTEETNLDNGDQDDTSHTYHIPMMHNISIATEEGSSIIIDINDTDQDGHPLTYIIKTPPTHGRVEYNNNKLSYIPEEHYHGEDSFSFVANNGKFNSAEATVNIVIRPKDPLPKHSIMQRIGNGSGGSFYGIFGLSDHKTMFITGDMGGLSRSEDAGKTWKLVDANNTLPYTTYNTVTAPLVVTEYPGEPDVLFGFRAYRLYLSLDRGKTWKAITTNAQKHSRGLGIVEFDGKKYLLIGMGYQNIAIKSQANSYSYLAAVVELPPIETIKSGGIKSLSKSSILNAKLITPGASKGYYTGFKSGGNLPVFAGPSGGVWVVDGNPTDKNSYINVTSHITELKDHILNLAVDDAVVDGDDLYIVAGGLAGKDTTEIQTKTTAGIYQLHLHAIQNGDFSYTKIVFDDNDIEILRGFDGFGSKEQKYKFAGTASLHNTNGVKYVYYIASSDIAFRYKIGSNKIENIARSKGAIYTKNGYQYVIALIHTPKYGESWFTSDSGNTYSINKIVVDGQKKEGIYKYCYKPSVAATNLMNDINGKLYIANIAEIKVFDDEKSYFSNYTSDVGSIGSYMDGVTIETSADKNQINNDSNGANYRDKLDVELPDREHTLTYYSTAVKDKNISNMVSTGIFFGNDKDMIETFMDAQSYYSPDDGKSWYWIPGGDAQMNDANFAFKAKDGNYYISERYGIYKFYPKEDDRASFKKIVIPQYTYKSMFGNPWVGENMTERKHQRFAYDKTNDVLVFSSIINQYKYSIIVIKNFTQDNPEINYFSDANKSIQGQYNQHDHKAIHWIKIVGKDVYFASGEFGVCKFNLDHIPISFGDTQNLTTKIGRTAEDKEYWSSASVVDGNTILSSLYNPEAIRKKLPYLKDNRYIALKSNYLDNYNAKVIEINLNSGESKEFLRPENIKINGIHPLTSRKSRRFDILYKKGDDLIGAFTSTTLWLYSHDGGTTWKAIKDIPIGGRYTLPGTYPQAVPENRGGGYILTFPFTAARFWF